MPTEKEVNRLVEDNFKLAQFMAAKWQHIDFDEALSIAMHALHEAAMNYDPASGFKFSGWAARQMKWKAGSHVHRQNTKGRGGGAVHVHLDAEIGFDGGGSTYAEAIADERVRHVGDELGDAEEANLMAECVKRLDEKERVIVEMRFGLNDNPRCTMDVIAERFDCSKQRIEQILKNKIFPRLKAIRKRIEAEIKREARIGIIKVEPVRQAIKKRPRRNLWPSHTKEAQRAYRLKNRERLRESYRQWLSKNKDRMRAWRKEWCKKRRVQINRLRLAFYYRHRERIIAERKEKYHANPEPHRARSRANHWLFRDVILIKQAAYRESRRPYLRRKANERAERLDDSVVRNYLAKQSGFTKKPDEFPQNEVNAKRDSILLKRRKIGIPNCPHCGRKGRKDGKFRPSGNQRYPCKDCKKCFGDPSINHDALI